MLGLLLDPQSVLAAIPSDRAVRHLRVTRRAMACDFSVIFPAEQVNAVEAGCAALDEIERLETKLTVYTLDSDISRVNQGAYEHPVAIDAEIFDLLAQAAALTEATKGAFDAAAGRLVKVWGFFDGRKRVPGPSELQEALNATGMRHVLLDAEKRTVAFTRPGVEFNLGSIGKGYAIDRALEVMRTQFGIRSALLHGGRSSLRALGAPPYEPRGWKVAIGDPFRKDASLGCVYLRDRALGTSGDEHQFFIHDGRRYGHVIDPRSAQPAEQVALASVVAPTAALADSLSTALYVLGLDGARAYCREHKDTGAIIARQNGDGRHEVITLGLEDGVFEPRGALPAVRRRPARTEPIQEGSS